MEKKWNSKARIVYLEKKIYLIIETLHISSNFGDMQDYIWTNKIRLQNIYEFLKFNINITLILNWVMLVQMFVVRLIIFVTINKCKRSDPQLKFHVYEHWISDHTMLVYIFNGIRSDGFGDVIFSERVSEINSKFAKCVE